MKNTLWVLILLLVSCANKPINVSSETNYTSNETETMNTKLKLEYKHKLYESKDKRWASHLTGMVITDYDHFDNQMKNNTFTTLGFEF